MTLAILWFPLQQSKMQLLSTLVRSRSTCLMLTTAAAVHLGAIALGLPSWQCPIRHGLGIPCPGCGLSRSTFALLQGDIKRSLSIHAFGAIALCLMALIVYAIVISKSRRIKLAGWLDRLEQRTKISAVLLSSFLVYWLIRLLWFRTELYQLVM